MTIYGELYTFRIEMFVFEADPKFSNMQTITMTAAGDEDFSIFELGPIIVNNIKMHVASCTINTTTYNDACIEVEQYKGQWIQITVRRARANPSDPIDSGEILAVVKDYIVRFE
jgi:hypothetical protein